MKLFTQLVASSTLAFCLAGGATAAVVSGTGYSVDYDDSASFFGVADFTPEGSISWGLYGTGSSFDAEQAKFVVGDGLSSILTLPSFTLMAKPGYVINSVSFNISGTGAARTFKWDAYRQNWSFTTTSGPAFAFDVQGIVDEVVVPGSPLFVNNYSVLMRSDEGPIYATKATLTLSVVPTAVPEPEHYLMLLSGLTALVLVRRTKLGASSRT